MPQSQRYISMDGLRGFAVMGILATNIISFAMPFAAYIAPATMEGDSSPADIASWIATFVLIDGKMRGLFALLFGASMMLILEKAEAAGQKPAAVFFRRQFWLAIFGLIHFFLIWYGDILFLYAVAGSLAFLFRRLENHKLLTWALIFYSLGFIIYALSGGMIIYMENLATMANASPGDIQDYYDIISNMGFGSAEINDEIAIYQSGSYRDIFLWRLHEDGWNLPYNMFTVVTETLPFMLLGVAMYKSGFLTGQKELSHYHKTALIYFTVALALYLVMIVYMAVFHFSTAHLLTSFLALAMIPRMVMTIGYAALLMIVLLQMKNGWFITRIAAVGRCAFSNYLGTSIVMTFIFYGYGLGLFAKIDRPWLFPVVLAAWAVMLLWSLPWLKRYQYGPLEWLWRSLARGSIQPMRRIN